MSLRKTMDSTVSPLFTFSNTTSMTGTDVTEQEMSAEEYDEYQAALRLFTVGMGINKYYLWPLFALGFPGNIASIITIFRMKSIGTFPVFVVMLALTHSLAILVKLLFYQLIEHEVMNTAGCCLLRFLGSWSSAYSSWVLVCMALERFVSVRFPLRTTIYNGSNATKILTAKILGVVGFVIGLIYVPLLWTSEIRLEGRLQCVYKKHYASFMLNVYFWILATVYAFVPFCLLTVFNCLIASQVRASFQSRVVVRNMPLMPSNQQNGAADPAEVPAQRQQRPQRNFHAIQAQINLMLLSAIVVFIILTFPICIFMLADSHWTVTPGYTRSNAIKYLCQQLAFVLVDSTHAVNFYLYFLSARRFRHHFLRLVTCKHCASRPSVGMPRAVTTVTWKICSTTE